MTNELIPITDEQAKAAQEIAKATGQGIEAATVFVEYWASVVGTAPRDLFALLLGDRLRHARLRNLHKLQVDTEKILKRRGVKAAQKVSEDIIVPLLEAARTQDRAELQELWARLLAAAMDPARSARFRMEFIETIKQMEPLDALVLQELSQGASHQPNNRDYCARRLSVSPDQVEVSIENLIRLKCVKSAGVTAPANAGLVAYGRTLLGALND